MFFERRCPGCGGGARTVCDACWSSLRSAVPLDLHGLDSVSTVADYDELVGRLVVAAKNGGRRDVLRLIARSVADRAVATRAVAERTVADQNLGRSAGVDVVTWVPASPEQRRARGFDQGRVVAGLVAARLGVPSVRLLRRRGAAQRGGGRAERLVGPSLDAARRSPPRIVLVDDVVTTGASLRRAADELRRSGASHVEGLAFASVHLPGRADG